MLLDSQSRVWRAVAKNNLPSEIFGVEAVETQESGQYLDSIENVRGGCNAL